jgi:hypothetical protein
MFVDFDWAFVEGKEESNTYPPFINTKQLFWAPGVEVGAEMTAEHDRDLITSVCGRGETAQKRATPDTIPTKDATEKSAAHEADVNTSGVAKLALIPENIVEDAKDDEHSLEMSEV